MSKFRWAYDQNGAKVPFIQTLPVVTTTAIEEGEIVKFTPVTGIEAVAGTDFDDPAVGVAMHAHDGATDDGVQKEATIRISTSPSAIYALKPSQVITATGGSTTTFVDSNLLPATDDYFNGGYIQIVTCAADSSLIGRRVKISDYTGSGGTITLAETLPAALASGDTAYLCPGPKAISAYGWDLNSDGTDINWESSGGESLQIVDVDPDTFTVFVKLRLHQFASYPAAL